MEFRHTGRADEAFARLTESSFDCIVIDAALPDLDLLPLLRQVRAAAPDAAVLVLTTVDDEAAGREVLRAGAQDWLVRGRLDRDGLLRALRHASDRQAVRRQLDHTNALLRAIRNVNQLITREKDPERLLAQTSRLLLEARGYRTVWIAAADPEGRTTIAEAGWDDGFRSFAERFESGWRPPCWTTASTTERLELRAPSRDCREACPLAGALGYLAAVVLPLRHAGEELGLLAISIPRPRLDETEQSLLVEVAQDLALALHDIRLEQRIRRYAQIVTASQEAMALVGPDHRYLEVNESYGRLVGRTPGDLLGRHVSDVLGREMYERLARPALETCLGGQRTELGTWAALGGGEPRTFEALYAPCRGPDGSVEAAAICIRDVTELRRAHAALQAERDNLRRITSAMPAALMMFDERGEMVFANPAAERLFGVRAADLPRRRCGDFLLCGHRDESPAGCGGSPACAACRINAALADALGPGRPTAGCETEVERRWNGSSERLALRVDAEPLTLDGRRHCVLAIADVTARWRAEEARRRAEEQLRLSQRMEALGTLAGGVAHDFNNLLSVILNCAEFALEAVGAAHPARADLVEIKKAGRRAEALTRQLLAFGRRQVLRPVPIDLNAVVLDVEPLVTRVLGASRELALRLSPDLGVVRADPAQIQQVLMNLAINARDAMPPNGRLTIETRNLSHEPPDCHAAGEPLEGPLVELVVSDTGMGMDEQTKLRLFEPFFTTKAHKGGHGLGLSSVFGIVRQSGGRIWVESEIGRGTTFHILLPRVWETAAAVVRTPEPPPSGGTETVLLVEDEATLRKVMRRTLAAAGYRVLEAADGEEALAVAGSLAGGIDLLLTDVVMPRMDGWTLADRLQQARPGLRVLFVSGHAEEAVARHKTPAGGAEILAKPFSPADLVRRVRRALDEPARGTT
ncbi:MAG: response regulator, partial [Myxococcales bacterium]|nr:response regulator [Myxococcales bacterium]